MTIPKMLHYNTNSEYIMILNTIYYLSITKIALVEVQMKQGKVTHGFNDLGGNRRQLKYRSEI